MDAAKHLVDNGADVNTREFWGILPIHLATKNDRVEMISFLAESGARPIEPPSISDTELAAADLEGRIIAIGCTQYHIVGEVTAPCGPHNNCPPLDGVIGRNIASVDGFPYSSAMADTQRGWTVEELNRFIADPAGRVPGT